MKSKKNIILLICLFVLSFVTFYRLLRPGYFSMMDEMHIFRLDQFDKCLKDDQFPCRFIQDGGMGYGYPLFNYYSPLAYGLAEIFHLVGFSLINSLKITFILSHLIGVFGMYFFASLFWGNLGGFISAIVFLLAPYQATDSFVRGAISESLAINIIPWIFYFLTKYINVNKYKFLLIFSLSSLLLTHNLTSLAISPVLLFYSFFLLFKNKSFNFKSIIKLSVIVLASIGISSFFLLPAIFEKNLVTVETMTQGYFNYIIHFATLNQLFISRFWGYGASLWGPVDDMAFSVGLIQWLLPLITIIFLLFKRKYKDQLPLIVLFFLVFLFSLFLTHNKSTFIWQLLPFMPYFQFPWRFLSIAIFSASFVSGSIILLTNKKNKIFFVVIITIITILLNISYFKEDIWYPRITDIQKLTPEEVTKQSGAGLKDYWPKSGDNYPESFAPNYPIILSGEVDFIKYYKNSRYSEGYFSVFSPKAIINLPIVYFPNWEFYLDDQKANFQINRNLGLIQFEVNQGQHHYELFFKNTIIRTIADYLSLTSLFIVLVWLFKDKTKNEK